MNPDQQHSPRSVRILVEELLDGVISEEDRKRLMDVLRSSESARRIYLSQVRLTTMLQLAADSRMNLGTMPVSPETLRREKRRSAYFSLVSAAAAMLVLGIGMALYHIGRPDPRISLQGSAESAYAIVQSEGGGESGNRSLAPGDQITISRGLLRLGFPSGVEALIEGPSQIEIVSNSTLRMDDGMGWFRVPEKAIGFTVRTARGRVIDLGTEFGIRHTAGGDIEVHVGKGKVRVAPSSPGMPEIDLTTGEALRLDLDGRIHPISARGSLFRQQFSRGIPHVHWSFDHQVDGAYPAVGTIPDARKSALEVRRTDGRVVSESGFQTDGVFGRAFSLKGDGGFGESAFPGIEGDAPRTVAAWIRYRGGLPESAADPLTGLGATTPFGKQAYLLNYTNAMLTTAQGATGQTIAEGVTYTLDFHTAALPGFKETEYLVELVALPSDVDDAGRVGSSSSDKPGIVLAASGGLVTTSDMRLHSRISYHAGGKNPHLGKELAIRLLKLSGPILYDNVRLTTRGDGGPETIVFEEDFENPVCVGYAQGVLPSAGWVGALQRPEFISKAYGSERHGIFSARPVDSMPFIAWEGPACRWRAFVSPSKVPTWCVADGDAFHVTSSPLPRDTWVHVATVHTGRVKANGQPEVIHYLDGKPVPVSVSTGTDSQTLHPARLLIGALPAAAPGDPTLDADIDELHILRAALDEKEIQTLMEKNVVVPVRD